MKEYPVFSDAWQDLKISPLWSDLKSYNKCNHGGKWCPGAITWGEGENEKRKGRYNRAILWPCSIMGVRGGKDRKEDANERVQRSRREGSVWLHWRMVVEGSKGGRARKEGGRCWCFAVASGVVEILQQRASPLLSNVHLILQILEKKQNNNKTSVIVVNDPSKRKQTTWPCFFVFHPLSFRTASD